jgi:hypothetical protein
MGISCHPSSSSSPAGSSGNMKGLVLGGGTEEVVDEEGLGTGSEGRKGLFAWGREEVEVEGYVDVDIFV